MIEYSFVFSFRIREFFECDEYFCLLEKGTRGMPSPRLVNRQSCVFDRIRKNQEVKVIIVLEEPRFQNYVDAEFRHKIFLLVYALLEVTDAGCDVINDF